MNHVKLVQNNYNIDRITATKSNKMEQLCVTSTKDNGQKLKLLVLLITKIMIADQCHEV